MTLLVAANASSWAYFGAKFEPPDGKVIHGAGDSEAGFDSYAQAVEPYTPAIFMVYYALGVSAGPLRIEHYLERYPGAIPQIGLDWVEFNDARVAALDHSVLEGRFDSALVALARYLRRLDRPVFVRPGFEFNGPWNNYDPNLFPEAFRKIVSTFRDEGALNVAFVWCFEPGGRRDFMKWYPGDQWVDWWGIDLFSPEQLSCEASRAFLGEAKNHRKPVMICESTPRYVGTRSHRIDVWQAWFKPYFDLIREHSHIKGFCYINADWRQRARWRDWGDCRVEQNPSILRLYKQELADDLYIHLGPKLNSALGYCPTYGLEDLAGE